MRSAVADASLQQTSLPAEFSTTRTRFFGPKTGGLIFNSPVDVSVFRIDHD